MNDFHGITEDEVILLIEDGVLLAEIAAKAGKSRSSLTRWIQADEQRSARAHASRSASASYWDERAQVEISLAQEPFELAKAKELAHHYRWRASKIAPRDYGDKVQQEISGPNGGAIQTEARVDIAGLTPEQLRALAGIKLPSE